MLQNLCFLPLQTLQTMKNRVISPQVALCCALGLRGVFVMVGLEVGYGDWRKYITGGLSDTFQTTSRQSDFCPNQKWLCVITLLIIDLYLWDYLWYMSFILCVVKSRSLICFTCIFHTCIYVFVECFRNLHVNSVVAAVYFSKIIVRLNCV